LDKMLFTTIIGSAAGILGTGLGGAIAFLLNDPGNRLLSTLISFSGGLMIAVVCFDLLPEAFEIAGLSVGVIGIVLGVLLVISLDELLKRGMRVSVRKAKGKSRHLSSYLHTGILLGVGIAIHNFPEGLAIGSGFTAVESYGITLSALIAIHDIPEGIAMATPMRIGGLGKLKVFLLAVLAGIPTGIGAFIGYLLGEISPLFISLCLGFAGGAMLYITCSELIPESYDLHRGRMTGLGLIAGTILGIVISSTL
jgi:ZIP family zinc transporter